MCPHLVKRHNLKTDHRLAHLVISCVIIHFYKNKLPNYLYGMSKLNTKSLHLTKVQRQQKLTGTKCAFSFYGQLVIFALRMRTQPHPTKPVWQTEIVTGPNWHLVDASPPFHEIHFEKWILEYALITLSLCTPLIGSFTALHNEFISRYLYRPFIAIYRELIISRQHWAPCTY